MPTNNTGKIVKNLYKKFPDKIAMLNTPQSFKKPYGKWAFDNGCFKYFNEKAYFKRLEESSKFQRPMWVAVPDVVGCHYRTLALWNYYYYRVQSFGYPLAFVAQDGCRPKDIPKEADWIFVGGLDPWKMDNIHKYVNGRPVHVGRVNGIGRLKYCESVGVTSVDGTGWLRQRSKQFYDFIEYFEGEKQRTFNGM
jgi:hypothetical protein